MERLLWHSDYPLLDKEVQRVTGLTDQKLAAEGLGPKKSLELLSIVIESSNMVLAHNKEYDEQLYKAECARHGIKPSETPWYCTLTEVPYPARFRCRQLSHLALDHGVVVDPSKLHRAIDDVRLMGQLLIRGGYTPEGIVAYAKAPWVYLQALIPAPWEDGGVGKERAQKAGFSWEKCRGTTEPVFPKKWVKRVKDLNAEKENDPGLKRVIIKESEEAGK